MSGLEVTMMKRIGELNEEVKRLKAEVERLTKAHSDALADFWSIHKGYFDLKAEVERLQHQIKYWQVEAQTDNARWLRCLDENERLRAYCKDVTLLKAELDQLRFENKRMKKGLPPSDADKESKQS